LRVSRRRWLQGVAGATVGLGAAAADGYKHLVPLLKPEARLLPGVPAWLATACRECPAGCGLLVKHCDGRVVKAEGNPDHPINAGRLCARGQAVLQGLYDPDRIRSPYRRDARGRRATRSWAEAVQALGAELSRVGSAGRVAVISDLQTGTLAWLIGQWLAAFGSDRYLVYEPLNYAPLRRANQALYHRDFVSVPNLRDHDLLVSFGVDFLETWLSPVLLTRQFAAARLPRVGEMAGFVYIGPRVSMTAANADRQWLVRPGDEWLVALAMLQHLQAAGLSRGSLPVTPSQLAPFAPETVAKRTGVPADAIRRLARAFAAARSPLALAGGALDGGTSSARAAVAAGLLNGAVGSPVPVGGAEHALGGCATLSEVAEFVGGLSHGLVDMLLVIHSNPAYSLPARLGFAEAARGVRTVVCLTPFADETAELARWVLPVSTPLEAWGDYEPQSGVRNLQQPVMGSPFDPRMAGDVLLQLAEAAGRSLASAVGGPTFYHCLRARWQGQQQATSPEQPFEEYWREGLQRGGAWSEPQAPVLPAPAAPPSDLFRPPAADDGPRLVLYPSITLFDGRGANRRWLQELPDPIAQTAWGSWIEVAPPQAQELDLATGDAVRVSAPPGHLQAPALVYPGLATGTVAMPLGNGHAAYGRYARGLGVNAFAMLPEEGLDEGLPVRLGRPSGEPGLPAAGGSPYQLGRGIVRTTTLSALPGLQAEALRMPLAEGFDQPEEMYPGHEHREHRWGMVVDLNRCTGCGACVTACYAENNIGVVGREQFGRNRIMAWIRVDRYWEWKALGAPVVFQPMLCQHCDAAPCESVCPVAAAAHNEEGVNMQVYNRCVGTRYCSHNCPYKVRRFNWFDYSWPEPLNWQANPEVTVRCRGVMEKCSFCIQRIRWAEYQAKLQNRPLRDGEISPACAQTCPAAVFTFGDLKDPRSRVSQLIAGEPRAYQVLSELNTRPAVVYLQRVLNDGAPV